MRLKTLLALPTVLLAVGCLAETETESEEVDEADAVLVDTADQDCPEGEKEEPGFNATKCSPVAPDP